MLLHRLRLDRRPLHRLADGLGVGGVVLLPRSFSHALLDRQVAMITAEDRYGQLRSYWARELRARLTYGFT